MEAWRSGFWDKSRVPCARAHKETSTNHGALRNRLAHSDGRQPVIKRCRRTLRSSSVNPELRTHFARAPAQTLGLGGWGGWVLLGSMGRHPPCRRQPPLEETRALVVPRVYAFAAASPPGAQITEAAAVAFPGKQLGHFATLPIMSTPRAARRAACRSGSLGSASPPTRLSRSTPR